MSSNPLSLSPAPDEGAISHTQDFENSTYKKVFWRVVPLFFLCYVVSYLDRVNIGFAKLQMLGDLKLDDNVYAFGASILFWGYILCELPSNIILHRVGARKWIARIMISWGLVCASLMFIEPLGQFFHIGSPTMFYILRFLLGVCEAGFFPGIVYYLNSWFPAQKQNRVFAGFMVALPLSLCLGSPLSGWLLENTQNFLGYRGWQWMLLLEGLPAVVLGFVVLFTLTDNIDKAHWLNNGEKTLLKSNLAKENKTKTKNFGAAFKNRSVWTLSFVLLTMLTGFYGLSFWLPSIIRATGLKNSFHIGLIAAIPYAIAGLVMIANAAHSNKTGERRWHAAIPALLSGIALILSAKFSSNLPVSMFLITIAASGIIGIMPIFWSFTGQLLSGIAAAAGLAMINSIGSLSGITGAMITNVVKNMTGDINNGTYVLGFSLLISFLLILSLPKSLATFTPQE